MSGPARRPLRRTLPGWIMLAGLFAALLGSAAVHDRPAFAHADRDDDGAVALPEAVAAGIPRGEARRAGVRDGNGLSREEWQAVDARPSPAATT